MVNLGAGDISDRLTILALKILYGIEAGKEVKHFVDERNALLTMIKGKTLNGMWFEHLLGLGAVNAALWIATDHLRGRAHAIEHEKDEGAIAEHRLQAGHQGIQMLKLNDQRAALIEQINKLSGDAIGPEKL